MRNERRPAIRTAVILLSSVLLGASALAADTWFEPSLAVEAGYLSRVDFTQGDEDEYGQATLLLPFGHTTERSNFSLELGASFRRFQDQEASDGEDYFANLTQISRTSERNTLTVRLGLPEPIQPSRSQRPTQHSFTLFQTGRADPQVRTRQRIPPESTLGLAYWSDGRSVRIRGADNGRHPGRPNRTIF